MISPTIVFVALIDLAPGRLARIEKVSKGRMDAGSIGSEKSTSRVLIGSTSVEGNSRGSGVKETQQAESTVHGRCRRSTGTGPAPNSSLRFVIGVSVKTRMRTLLTMPFEFGSLESSFVSRNRLPIESTSPSLQATAAGGREGQGQDEVEARACRSDRCPPGSP